MKTRLMLFALMAITLVLVGLTGCNKNKKTAKTDEATIQEQPVAEQKAVKEHPATAKPKDHPAH